MNPLFLFLCWFDPVLGPSESHNRGRYVQHIQYSSAIDHVVPELAQPPRNRKKSHNHFAWLFASSWPIESWFCSPLGIIIPTYLMLGACMVWVHREADDVNQETDICQCAHSELISSRRTTFKGAFHYHVIIAILDRPPVLLQLLESGGFSQSGPTSPSKPPPKPLSSPWCSNSVPCWQGPKASRQLLVSSFHLYLTLVSTLEFSVRFKHVCNRVGETVGVWMEPCWRYRGVVSRCHEVPFESPSFYILIPTFRFSMCSLFVILSAGQICR